MRSCAGLLLACGLAAMLTGVAAPRDGATQSQQGHHASGPDFGAMLNEMLQREALLQQQMQQTESQIVQQVMQDPRAQALYRQHLSGGGQMSFPEFAYAYAATGGFTPEGIRRYRQSEAVNQAREQQARQGLRQIEAARGKTQATLLEENARRQDEAGGALRPPTSWIDPTTGETYVPADLGAEPIHDPFTGKYYALDEQGTPWVGTPDGYWYPMTPAK